MWVWAECLNLVSNHGALAGKTVVITAGPTREAIDPVRYISNYSSGKMGYALAQAAVVISAEEMYQASMNALADCDIFIASAAVADFRPAAAVDQKMKKTAKDTMTIDMVKNPDIVATVAASNNKPFVVGFAAETNDVVAYAKDKRQRKNLDLIVANDVSDQAIGFNSDNNAVTVISENDEISLPEASKFQLAQKIVDIITCQLSK